MMPTLPIECVVDGRLALVLGADQLTLPKIHRLLEAGADVRVFACDLPIHEEATALDVSDGFPDNALLDRSVVTYVSPSVPGSERLHERARRAGRLLCTLDRPEHCTFVNPAAFEAGGFRFRIFSGGAVPGLVAALRVKLQAALDQPSWTRLVTQLTELRARTPRGKRAAVVGEALVGLSIEVKLHLPNWLSPT